MNSVVFDCMIYLQAVTREESPSRTCFRLAEQQSVQLFTSEKTLTELEDVLKRPRTRKKFPQLTTERVNEYLELIRTVATVITIVPTHGIYLRDPKDIPYLDLAVATQSEFLVSRDNDLLDLMKESSQEGIMLRKLFPTLSILDPVSFLAHLQHSPSTPPP